MRKPLALCAESDEDPAEVRGDVIGCCIASMGYIEYRRLR